MTEPKNYGKLTPQEQLELRNLATREQTLQSLMQRLIQEQEQYNQQREQWFRKIRGKYRIPDEAPINITEEKWIYAADL